MKWLIWIEKWLFEIIISTLKVFLIISTSLCFLLLFLHWLKGGETIFTNKGRIIHRLDKEALPLIEKYHVTWIHESSKCRSIDYQEGLYTNHINCVRPPAKLFDSAHLAFYKKIRDVSLSNALWENDFKEARIQFNDNNQVNYAEFYFNCSCYELYIYYRNPLELNGHKIAHPYWFFDKW